MKIKRVFDNKEVEDDIRYEITLTPLKADADEYALTEHDANVVLSGKELKQIVNLINSFSKIQDNPAPLAGLGSMLDMMKKFETK